MARHWLVSRATRGSWDAFRTNGAPCCVAIKSISQSAAEAVVRGPDATKVAPSLGRVVFMA